MSINRSSRLPYLAAAGATALVLTGCEPDSKESVDHVRAGATSVEPSNAAEFVVDPARVRTAAVIAPRPEGFAADQFRAELRADCLKKGAEQYHSAYRRVFSVLEGENTDIRSKKFHKGRDSVEVDLNHCSVRARRAGELACFDPGGRGVWVERCEGECPSNNPAWGIGQRKLERDPERWKLIGQKCSDVYNSVLKRYGIDGV